MRHPTAQIATAVAGALRALSWCAPIALSRLPTAPVIEKAQFVTIPILDARLAIVTARIDALEAKLDAKFERWTTRMIIAMVLSQTATGPIGMHVFESLKRVLATLAY